MKKLLARSLVVWVSVLAMTRQEYNDLRGWDLPENENGDDPGYLIEDPAGEKNTPQFDGYIQWLPQAEFERKFAIENNESDTGEGKAVTEQELVEKAVAPRVTKADIDVLLDRVEVHTTTCQDPTPHVMAIAWLDGKFHLGTAISKSVNPENFNEEIGIQYSTKDVLEIAENKLWELEGYRLFHG